jgi:3-oxosteroid 1-dehydrogenase
MLADGDLDSREQALAYLSSVVGDEGPATSDKRRQAFVDTAPQVLRFLESEGFRFRRTLGYPDYYPDQPGASLSGRAVEGAVFDRTLLGAWNDRLPRHLGRRALPLGSLDAADFVRATRTLRGLRTFTRITGMQAFGRLRGRQLAAGGGSLIGQLLLAAVRNGIPIEPETALVDLLADAEAGGPRVVGAVVQRGGERHELRAEAGVLIASGGFARNESLRRTHQPQPIGAEWTSACKGDTGEGIEIGERAGGALALMDEAWWGPASLRPDGRPVFHVWERSLPGSIMVDAAGERFVNESSSYIDVVHAMYARGATRGASHGAVPAWLVFDTRYRRRYPFGLSPPARTPRELIDGGYFHRADTLARLGAQIGVDAAGLQRTVERFNAMAARGADEDFRRGESAYDRYYGDPRVNRTPASPRCRRRRSMRSRSFPATSGPKVGS